MKRRKTCRGCYWAEQCATWRACENYTPISNDPDMAAYEEDLRERAEYYEELVYEQDQ